jgi:hypothetical protein
MIAMHLRKNESEQRPGMTEAELIAYYVKEARASTEEEKEGERDLVSRILRRLVSKDGVLIVVSAGDGGDEEESSGKSESDRLLRVHPNFLPSSGM